jgi:hypothetical protein
VLPRKTRCSFTAKSLLPLIKVWTSDKKGRHLSTREAIRLIEEFGVETTERSGQGAKSTLKKITFNRYLHQWGYETEFLPLETLAMLPSRRRIRDGSLAAILNDTVEHGGKVYPPWPKETKPV